MVDGKTNEHLKIDLYLFCENTGELYGDIRAAVKIMAEAKIEDNVIPPSVLMHWRDIVARGIWMYHREIDSDTHFSIEIRNEVAQEWAERYLQRIKLGEEGLYDE